MRVIAQLLGVVFIVFGFCVFASLALIATLVERMIFTIKSRSRV